MPTRRARRARRRRPHGADLVVLSELFIAGYPPEDLVLKPAFQSACRAAIEALARETADGGPAMLIGTPWVEDGKLYNACRAARRRADRRAPLQGQSAELRRVRRKAPVRARPGRGSGDDSRQSGSAVPICEDIWLEESEDYENVVECLAETGAEILIVPNGSPYARDKNDLRLSIAVARVTESGLPLVYLNQVGGQDELVFDGASFALNADLSVAAQLPAFEENITTLRWSKKTTNGWRCTGPVAPVLDGDKADYAACVLGLRDYVGKNGFPGVLLGDIRRHRFGAVRGDCGRCAGRRACPRRDAAVPFHRAGVARRRREARKALGIRYEVLPIAPAVNGFEEILSDTFAGLPRDITEENLQARTRGTLLMAISNKTGAMVVTTGNKSEMSVGYATLYGDMNGGFNPIKDIYKTEVFRLSISAQFMEAGRRAWPVGRGHSGQHHHPAADRGTARKPDRPGFAAALRHARRDPGTAGRARRAAGVDRGRRASIARWWRGSTGCSTSPNTSAGRPRRASRSRKGISAATAAIPSPTGFATSASRCPNPTRPWYRARAADRRKRSTDSFAIISPG